MELVRLFVVVLNKLLKLRPKVRAVGIGRISRCHIVLGGQQFKEGDGIPGLAGQEGTALSLSILLDRCFQVGEEGSGKVLVRRNLHGCKQLRLG